MRVKICGITKPDQGDAIAQLGATALGFICVPTSPRYVTSAQIRAVVEHLSVNVDRIGVFANTTIEEVCQTVSAAVLNGVELHGNESPDCVISYAVITNRRANSEAGSPAYPRVFNPYRRVQQRS